MKISTKKVTRKTGGILGAEGVAKRIERFIKTRRVFEKGY